MITDWCYSQRLFIHAIDLPFFLVNSKRKLRSCCKWRSKSTASMRLDKLVTLEHIHRQRVNPKLILIQHFFSFNSFVTEEKAAPRRTSNRIWQITSLWLKLRVFWLTKFEHLNKRSWSLMVVELKQVIIPVSRQLCNKISFDTSIFCTFLKIIFLSWQLLRTKAQSLASKNR